MVRTSVAVAVLAMTFSLLALAVPAVAQVPAPVPSHNVGDKVGFGATIDLGALAAPFLDQVRLLDQMDDNFTIHQLNFTGSADIWVYMEVIEEVAGSHYTIQEEHASGVRARFVADVTTAMNPVPGTYQGTNNFGDCIPPAFPTEPHRASVTLQISFLATASGPSTWNVSDFALRESTTNVSVDLRVSTSLRGIPSVVNNSACEYTVSYEDRDLAITADVDTELREVYTPALDVFDFPINDGEAWWANSTAAVSGRISGTVHVVGLNATEEQDFFDTLNAILGASGYVVTGLTGFPIVLEDIRITLGAVDYLRDGEIRSFAAPVAQNLVARHSQVILADDQLHDVYLLSSAAMIPGLPGCGWVYSPDDGFIVGFLCEAAPGVPFFSLDNVPADEARQEVDRTEVEYSVALPTANPLLDFFLKAPYLGLLLVLAAVIVIAALLTRRRRRPMIAPPGPAYGAPPPQGPMPPESPPPTGP